MPTKTPINSENYPFQNVSLATSKRVEDLLSRMTLPEKIGQMTQLNIGMINLTGVQKDVSLNLKKARKLIQNHHIGSFLNGEAVPPSQWFEYTSKLARIAVEETRLGIPIIYGIDHIHGATYVEGTTIFPQAINLGATFNPKHAFNTGLITALESSDLGHNWNFAPVLDVGVNPLWPRLYETYGEDPLLAGMMGAEYVRGYQGYSDSNQPGTAATGKHFLGYSDPRSGWDRTPAYLSMQKIYETHCPSFQMAIDAGLKTIMVNSGEINGVPVHASHELLTTLLRHKMGFEGVIVTDWEDIGKLVNFHYTSPNYTEATYDAVMAGIDVSMTPNSLDFNHSLLELVEKGRIPESRIDESVRRILKLKFDLGLFENPYPRNDRFDRIGIKENKQKAIEAAEESLVLLKNKNLLPLKSPKRIGVFGPSANSKRNLAGGWTLAWQGAKEEKYPDSVSTVYEAIKKKFKHSKVKLFEFGKFPTLKKEKLKLIEKLSDFDVLIYAGGEEPYTEFAGNINDLGFPVDQCAEINLISKSKSPLLLILVQGRPLLLNQVEKNADAILFAGLPGFEGAEAIANVISGKINPSGKLTISYPRYPNHYLTYNHKRSDMYSFNPDEANYIVQKDLKDALFPFGHGLSYTTFKYSKLKLSDSLLHKNGNINCEVTVTNSGKVDGYETVLWYTSTHFGRISRPIKELKHFEKIWLKAGESRKLHFMISESHLAYSDENGTPIIEKHGYSVLIGELTKDFNYSS